MRKVMEHVWNVVISFLFLLTSQSLHHMVLAELSNYNITKPKALSHTVVETFNITEMQLLRKNLGDLITQEVETSLGYDPKKLFEFCQSNFQCQVTDRNAFCNKTCQCLPGYGVLDGYVVKCHPLSARKLTRNCWHIDECLIIDINSECSANGLCVCKETYSLRYGTCQPKRIDFNGLHRSYIICGIIGIIIILLVFAGISLFKRCLQHPDLQEPQTLIADSTDNTLNERSLTEDKPPSYDEIIKHEAYPPRYTDIPSQNNILGFPEYKYSGTHPPPEIHMYCRNSNSPMTRFQYNS